MNTRWAEPEERSFQAMSSKGGRAMHRRCVVMLTSDFFSERAARNGKDHHGTGTKDRGVRSTLAASAIFRHLRSTPEDGQQLQGVSKDSGSRCRNQDISSDRQAGCPQRASGKCYSLTTRPSTNRILADVEKDPEKNTLFMTISNAIVGPFPLETSPATRISQLICTLILPVLSSQCFTLELAWDKPEIRYWSTRRSDPHASQVYRWLTEVTATPLVDELVMSR